MKDFIGKKNLDCSSSLTSQIVCPEPDSNVAFQNNWTKLSNSRLQHKVPSHQMAYVFELF